MSFVHPYFLIALIAIAIPIIIHLFNFRRYKKVHFTNVKFIEQVRKKTKKKSQVKHLIVLAIRILAVASLVMAFAQPYIPVDDQLKRTESDNLVSIYIDNSFSMQAQSKGGSLLDEARKMTEDIAMAYKQSDVFYLVTNDFERKNQRLVSREELIEALSEIGFSPSVRQMDEIITRQTDFLYDSDIDSKAAFIISDFQESVTSFDKAQLDTNTRIYLVPVMAEQSDNIYIDSCWFENPVHQVHQQSKLFVRINNASGINYEKIPVKLSINGTQKAIASFDLGPGEFIDVIIPYTHHEPGYKKATLEITDYPVVYDDVFYFTYNVQELIPVLSIFEKEQNPYLMSFFENDSAFLFNSLPEGNLNYTELQRNNLILLDQLTRITSGLTQELLRFVNKGGSIAVIPPPEMDIQSYQSFTKAFDACSYGHLDSNESRVTYLNARHLLFYDVFENWGEDQQSQGSNIDLPIVLMHYPLQYPSLTLTEKLMILGNDQDFLNVLPYGKGKIYLLASPLDPVYTNLPKHAIFVPMLYKMALLSQPYHPLYFTIGGLSDRIELPDYGLAADQVFKVRKTDNGNEFIPEHRNLQDGTDIILHQQIQEGGHYVVSEGEKDIYAMAFNYDRRESNLALMGEDDIEDRLTSAGIGNISIFSTFGKPVSQSIQELNEGIRLWKLFIIFVLIFLAAETILLRLWK